LLLLLNNNNNNNNNNKHMIDYETAKEKTEYLQTTKLV